MKTVEKEVNKFNFPQILLDLHRESKTGTLTVDTADVIKKVYLDRGKAVFASSTDEDDRLGETLIKLGKITIEQYEKSVELLKETGKRQGTILVELGYLTPKDLVLGVKAQVREIIYSLFQVEYAEYEFDERPLPTREVITLQMSMGNLIYEGMKKINNVVRIKRDMPDMDAVLKLNDDPASLFQNIVLTPRDKAMIEMIDGTKTIKEIIDSTPTATFEALKTLYILFVSGFVEEQRNAEKSEEREIIPDEMAESPGRAEEAFEGRVNELFSNLYKMNPHEILGIDETSDEQTIQSNYYKLVKEFHPDQHISSIDPLMLDKLITISEEIQKAYVLLKEDEKRRDYFQAIEKNLQDDIGNTYAEEHFRSELSKVSEEILFSRDTFDEPEIEGNKNGESLCDIQSVEPATFDDYKVEEEFESSDAKRDEEILSSRDSSVGVDNEMPWDEIDTHEQTPEHTPIDGQLAEAQPEETNKELYAEAPDEAEQKDEVQVKRKYTRFQVHDAGVNGEMLFSEEVNLVDISTSGIALKVDRQLKIGREYLISLHAEDEFISIKGEVIRSTLSETKTDSAGNIIPLYLVGMEFKNVSSNKAEQIDEFIKNHKIDEVKIDTGCILSGTRLRARFQLDSTDTYILESQTSYKVKVLSLCGMMIESEQAISLNDSVQMEMSLPEDGTINILGRIVSYREIDVDPERYDIAIEFIEISEEDRGKLQTFLDGISDLQQLRATPGGNDARYEEVTEQSENHMEESDSALAHEQYDRDLGAEREASSQDAINLQLINLIEEIKLLLTQLRTELPGAAVSNTPAMETSGVSAETKECRFETSTEPVMLQENSPDDLQKVWQEEYITVPEAVQKYISEQEQEMPREEQQTEPQKDIPGKKKLKLWYIAIPVLFLIAAIVSFLVLYSPEKQKVISQPVQPTHDKKQVLPPAQPANVVNEALPSVQKNPESAPVPAPEVKAASTAATPPAAAPHTLELIASDSTWLLATIDEKAAKEMILRPGDRIKWTAKTSISLIIGNAAGLKLVFDGKEFGPLGEKGKVVKVKLPSSGNK